MLKGKTLLWFSYSYYWGAQVCLKKNLIKLKDTNWTSLQFPTAVLSRKALILSESIS